MSFGFSVGDFLAAASLIEQAISALRDAGGSAFQYERVALELHTLNRTLQAVDHLEAEEGLEAIVEAIKATALTCQLPLREFLESTRKYDKSLGIGQTGGIMKDVFYKVKWVASKKMEAATKLHAEITAYLGGINLLLGLYQVFGLDSASLCTRPLTFFGRKLRALEERRLRQRLEGLNTTLANMKIQNRAIIDDVDTVRERVEEGTKLVRMDIDKSSKQTSQALQKLQQNCTVTFSIFLKKACVVSEVTLNTLLDSALFKRKSGADALHSAKVTQIYNVLLSVQSNLSNLNTRHTWLQDPMKFEDAYGRVVPIPVEFDYSMMEGIIRGKFQSGRGKVLVERNQWKLFNPANPQNLLSAENWEPLPGMKITMAMIIPQKNEDMVCPRLNCPSKSYRDALGGGKICCVCEAWFDRIDEGLTNRRFTDLDDDREPTPIRESQASVSLGNEFEVARNDLESLKNAVLRSGAGRVCTACGLTCDWCNRSSRKTRELY
ncbi:hypothetical protein G7Y89_g12151 [Cudoniella acicularis]|uniref:Ubiquitin-like domain-containing protein n=1 Tax=Cudoniella acicularis TaxID=354080 RepID=A0A8H4RB02_9HELO|nr:hypothetical protein G7Y89_g12151 [Cudoniella acicularis]